MMMAVLVFIGVIFLTFQSTSGWILSTRDRDARNKMEKGSDIKDTDYYSCFPWIFNPGCYFNKWVDWSLVCRTNTLGWEQCDVLKKQKAEAKLSNKIAATKLNIKIAATTNRQLAEEDIIEEIVSTKLCENATVYDNEKSPEQNFAKSSKNTEAIFGDVSSEDTNILLPKTKNSNDEARKDKQETKPIQNETLIQANNFTDSFTNEESTTTTIVPEDLNAQEIEFNSASNVEFSTGNRNGNVDAHITVEGDVNNLSDPPFNTFQDDESHQSLSDMEQLDLEEDTEDDA